MARNASNSEILTKRNAKLESFLKLNLSSHVFEKIRAYEACIVNFRKEKRAFKFAVLSDERVYLTENPPKTIRDEDAVHLGDIIAINLVNEFPDFLNGEERENAQHIQVIYKKPVKKTSELNNGDNDRGEDEHSEGAKHSSNNSSQVGIPGVLVTEANENSVQSKQSQKVSKPGDRLLQLPKKKLNRSFDESEMRMLKELQLQESSGSDDDRLSSSCPSSEWSELSRASSVSSIDSFNSPVTKQGKNKLVTVDTIRPLPQRPGGSKGGSPRPVDGKNLHSEVSSLAGSKSEAERLSQTEYRSLPFPDNVYDNRNKEPFHFSLSLKELNNNFAKSPFGRTLSLDSALPEKENNNTGISKSKLSSAIKKKKKSFSELHLFILSQSSPFLKHLRCSWNNHIMRSTLLLDSHIADRWKVNSSKATSSKQLEHQFSQLKQEILNTGGSMEMLFSLVQELSNAAEKYFALKRFFWKNEDLLMVIVRNLQSYLPKSSADLLTENGRHKRADELELAILLIETLGMMLHDTETIPNRLTILKASSGKIMMDLLVVLTCLPEIPQRWRPPKSKAHSLFQTNADEWESSADAEVSKLVQELTNASTAVLYELILIAQQATWVSDEGQFLNVTWLVHFLNSRKAATFNFVERLLAQAMKLLLPSRDETLVPAEAVLLFQQFSVLQTLLQNSGVVSVHVRDNYTEEFRYYIQSPHIVNKLPSNFPITRHVFQLIEQVLCHVLQSSVSIAPS